jgi:hypothetical protein
LESPIAVFYDIGLGEEKEFSLTTHLGAKERPDRPGTLRPWVG